MAEGESICDFAGKNGDDAGDGFLLVVKQGELEMPIIN